MDFESEASRESRFKDAVLSAAEARRMRIIAEAQQQSEKKLEIAQLSCQEADHDLIAAAHERDGERRHSAAIQAERAKLLQLRTELVDGVFAEAEEKLTAFTQEKGYAAWLMEKAKAHFKADGPAGHVTVYLRRQDMDQADAFKAALPGCRVQADEEIRLGGLKLSDGRVLYDETLDGALTAERERFYADSGLVI